MSNPEEGSSSNRSKLDDCFREFDALLKDLKVDRQQTNKALEKYLRSEKESDDKIAALKLQHADAVRCYNEAKVRYETHLDRCIQMPQVLKIGAANEDDENFISTLARTFEALRVALEKADAEVGLLDKEIESERGRLNVTRGRIQQATENIKRLDELIGHWEGVRAAAANASNSKSSF